MKKLLSSSAAFFEAFIKEAKLLLRHISSSLVTFVCKNINIIAHLEGNTLPDVWVNRYCPVLLVSLPAADFQNLNDRNHDCNQLQRKCYLNYLIGLFICYYLNE